jgi:hypothetical protein
MALAYIIIACNNDQTVHLESVRLLIDRVHDSSRLPSGSKIVIEACSCLKVVQKNATLTLAVLVLLGFFKQQAVQLLEVLPLRQRRIMHAPTPGIGIG